MGKHRRFNVKRYSALLLIGELLITAGFVLGSYVAYELWVSNFTAQRTWTTSSTDLTEEFSAEFKNYLAENPIPPEKIEITQTPKSGKPFGLMYFPKLWASEKVVPIITGISDSDLAKGIGYYPNTSLPGEVGNFAVAGHRATHGEPFADFPLIEVGDEVIVETFAGRYVYELVDDIKVMPEDVWVIGSRPNVPGVMALPEDSKLITLTTCDPRWSSENRWIWFGVQKSFTSRYELERRT